jgi:hypothetical protein
VVRRARGTASARADAHRASRTVAARLCGRFPRRAARARSRPSSTHSMDCSGICATRARCSSAFSPTPRTSFGRRSPVSRCTSSC